MPTSILPQNQDGQELYHAISSGWGEARLVRKVIDDITDSGVSKLSISVPKDRNWQMVRKSHVIDWSSTALN